MTDIDSVALSEAKDRLSHLVRQVADSGVRFTITVGGREAAELVPVGTAAVPDGPRSPWVLVSTVIDTMPAPFERPDPDRGVEGTAAGVYVDQVRGRKQEDGASGTRSNSILWLNLDTRAAILAYPTAHWDAFGRFEFIFADASGASYVKLREWGQKQDSWDSDSAAQGACHAAAIAFGCRMLGAAQ